jgi:hypothetical protein
MIILYLIQISVENKHLETKLIRNESKIQLNENYCFIKYTQKLKLQLISNQVDQIFQC